MLDAFQSQMDEFGLFTRNVKESQDKKLESILQNAKDTQFSRDFIPNEDTFHELPVQDYEAFAPYIERMRNGSKNELTKEPIIAFVQTSGTSSGRKFIPYTQGLLKEFQVSTGAWIANVLTHFPELQNQKWYWSITGNTKEDLAYFTAEQQKTIIPRLLFPKGDFFKGTQEVLKENPQFVSIWSPTFLNNFELREPIFLSCWADASSKVFVQKLQERFVNTYLQPKGLVATEGITSIPIIGQEDHVLSHSHYVEFEQDGSLFRMDEVKKGESYGVILTTSGGLYRYRTGDQVEVVGSFNQAPTIKFLGRDKTFDLVGEKMSELDIIRAQQTLDGIYSLVRPNTSKRRYEVFTDSPVSKSNRGEFEESLCQNPYTNQAFLRGQLNPIKWVVVEDLEEKYIQRQMKKGSSRGDVKPATITEESI